MLFTNVSANTFNLVDFGGNLLATMTTGQARFFYLTDNTTANGSWRSTPWGQGTAGVTSIQVISDNDNVTVAPGTPITGAGIYTLDLANDLLALTSFDALTGFSTRTAANTWSLRTMTGTAGQIVIANGAGIAGDPLFGLDANVTGLDSLAVGNISISVNTITSVNALGNLILSTNDPAALVEVDGNLKIDTGFEIRLYNGAFYSSLEAGIQAANINYILPTTYPTVSQVLRVANPGPPVTLEWANIPTFPGVSTEHAIARYSDAFGALENSGVLISDTNDITGAASLTVGNITLSTVANTIGTTIGALTLDPNGASNVIITGITYPQNTTAGNVESSVFTMDGFNNVVFSANVNDNLIYNGAMDIWQRGSLIDSTSLFFTNNSGSYTADGWYMESGLNAAPVNDVISLEKFALVGTSVACSFNNVMRCTVTTTGNKFAIFHFLDSDQTAKVVGQAVSFAFVCATDSNVDRNIRASILSWSGAADTLTKPVITDFGADNTVLPTLAASWDYVSTLASTPINTALTRLKIKNVTVPANCTNLAVMLLYNDATALNGATFDFSAIKLEQGASCTAFYPRPFQTEMQLSKLRFAKDLPIDTDPAVTTLSSDMFFPIIGVFPIPNAGFASTYAQLLFDVEMRDTPTVTFYSYTAATANMASNYDNTPYSDLAANTAIAVNIDKKGCLIQNQSAGNITVGTANFNEIVAHHWRSADL
jgi:hypothetical protein